MRVAERIFLVVLFCLYLSGSQLLISQSSGNPSIDFNDLFEDAKIQSFFTHQLTKSLDEDLDPSIIQYKLTSNREVALKNINSSNWDLSSDKTAWIQELRFPENSEIFLRLDKINLEQNEVLQVYDLHTNQLLNTYDYRDQSTLVGPVSSNRIGLLVKSQSKSVLDKITIGEVYVGTVDFGFASSFECHENITCDAGGDYRDQERATVKITMVLDEGIGFCTGGLMNNTSGDKDKLLLTAFHCQDGYTPIYDMWEFDFGFKSFSCANPDSEPESVKVIGCERLAGYLDTDMLLLRITGDIPEEANPYFAGWNRDSNYVSSSAVLIHHPRGDIKKISIDGDSVKPHTQILGWNNDTRTSANSHLETNFDGSTYEGGSSGGPIFDSEGLLIAQLHGGPVATDCTLGVGYHGWIAKSWDGGGTPDTRVKDWLDPIGSDTLEIHGINGVESQSSFVSFIGRVTTPDGIAIPNTVVTINGDKEESFLTGADGRFAFDNLEKSGSYSISFSKDSNHGNGVSGIDMVQVMNHILNTNPLRGVFQQRAADVNADTKVSSLDLVQMLNVVVNNLAFPESKSWRFEPSTIQMEAGSFDSASLERGIIGYKVGDVNFSANPRN